MENGDSKNNTLPDNPVLYGPDNKPLRLNATEPNKTETRLPTAPPLPKKRRISKPVSDQQSFLRRHVAWVLPTIGLLASLATFYAIRPKPTAIGALSSSTSDPYAPRFSLSNSGDFSMRHVEAVCDYTKLIFQRTDTLKLEDRFVASMYRVPDVGPGEGFIVKCPEMWRWLTSPDMTYGMITIGDLAPQDPKYPPRSFYFKILKDGNIQFVNLPHNTMVRCENCILYPVTDLDLTIRINYSTFLPWIKFTRSVRFIGSQGPDGVIAWQSAPLSQPPIKDPIRGPIFTLGGGQTVITNDVPNPPE